MASRLEGEYARLFEQEAERLWRALYAFSQDREIAADAVSEAFAQCIRRGDAVRSPARWVWRTAFRIAAGQLKERHRWGTLDREPSYEMPDPPGPVMAALRLLPHTQRAAVVLTHYAGYDARAVGEALGCSAATARVHASRGRKRLRKILERSDD